MAIFVTMIKMIKMAFNDIKCISGYIFVTIKSIIKQEASVGILVRVLGMMTNGQNTDIIRN